MQQVHENICCRHLVRRIPEKPALGEVQRRVLASGDVHDLKIQPNVHCRPNFDTPKRSRVARIHRHLFWMHKQMHSLHAYRSACTTSNRWPCWRKFKGHPCKLIVAWTKERDSGHHSEVYALEPIFSCTWFPYENHDLSQRPPPKIMLVSYPAGIASTLDGAKQISGEPLTKQLDRRGASGSWMLKITECNW